MRRSDARKPTGRNLLLQPNELLGGFGRKSRYGPGGGPSGEIAPHFGNEEPCAEVPQLQYPAGLSFVSSISPIVISLADEPGEETRQTCKYTT